MQGIWPESYLHNPTPRKNIEQIWDDLDAYSFEELYELPDYRGSLTLHIPLPPLKRRFGRLIKGFCFTQGAHLLIARYPCIKKLFHVCANSMCCAYPWAHEADCFFTCYRNRARESYYKAKYPNTQNIICLPLQDADYTNDQIMKPVPDTPKTIDVFCVSTAFPVKNMPLIAQALKAYEQKYGRRLKVVYAIGAHEAKKRSDGSLDYTALTPYAREQLQQVDTVLGDTKSYIDFIPYINYRELPKYYSAARCGVLGSLIEGKNRFLHEGMCCDMPVIAFRQFNQFTRGTDETIYPQCGEYIPEFTPQSVAETIHFVLNNPQKYHPRETYLHYGGRKTFMRRVLDEIPYYHQRLPRYGKEDLFENTFLNRTCQRLYGVDYRAFLYDECCRFSNIAGLNHIATCLKEYCNLFHIRFEEHPEPAAIHLKNTE